MDKYNIIIPALVISILGALAFAWVYLSDAKYAPCVPVGYVGYERCYANLGDYQYSRISEGFQNIVHSVMH
jgi:hypothetical protein